MKKFNITWTPGDDGGAAITGHDVGYTPSGGSETVVSTGSTTAAYTLGGLTDDVEYSVRVRAENSAGKGAWSAAVVQVAALPQLLTDTNGESDAYGGYTGTGTAADPLYLALNGANFYGTQDVYFRVTVGVPGTVYCEMSQSGAGGPRMQGFDGTTLMISNNIDPQAPLFGAGYGYPQPQTRSLTIPTAGWNVGLYGDGRGIIGASYLKYWLVPS